MYLVFDFETTGISDNNCPIYQQRAIQLAWQVLDSNMSPITCTNYYIGGNPIINTDFHANLSVEFLNENGSDAQSVLQNFMNDLKTVGEHSGMLVAHNIEFDFSVLINELTIEGLLEQNQEYQQIIAYFSNNQNQYCTMKRSVDYCKLPKHNASRSSHSYGNKRRDLGYKYPRLVELYRFLFNKEPILELHDATNDVIITVRCFAKLKDIGI